MNKYIVLIAVALGVVILIIVLRHGSYFFKVTNSTTTVIEECIVYIGEKRFEFNKLEQGASATESVTVHQDTHFIVLVRLDTGKEMYAELGYACVGVELVGEISITDAGITLNNDSGIDAQ